MNDFARALNKQLILFIFQAIKIICTWSLVMVMCRIDPNILDFHYTFPYDKFKIYSPKKYFIIFFPASNEFSSTSA